VMGTHGAGGFEHLLLGSVTEKVVRKALCPVVTVSPLSGAVRSMPYERILCPIDFSDVTPAIVEFAASLAYESDVTMTLLHVLEWPNGAEPLNTRHFNVPEYQGCREKDAAEAMTRLIEKTLRGDRRVQTWLAHGKPYREILRIAAEQKSDVIVMGVQGRNALDVTLFGSTTNHVVRRATCPVLTFRQ
jgi:nucleotide-binding universal stress UspA family protein